MAKGGMYGTHSPKSDRAKPNSKTALSAYGDPPRLKEPVRIGGPRRENIC